jgi:TPR repeat protein
VLLARGDALFGNGDIVSARLFYERAAEGGDAQAALRLGETYDPAFLARARLNGVHGDAAAAARWYRHALGLGAAEAEILLTDVAASEELAKGSRK